MDLPQKLEIHAGAAPKDPCLDSFQQMNGRKAPQPGGMNDPESEDLMIGRITLHQKNIWMLKSFLKN